MTQTQLLIEGRDRLEPAGEFRDGVEAFVLRVPETIPQLGYASHQFFRYYGKFPSVVGREIVARFLPSGGTVLDFYAGSGTTLVEAQIAGCRSFGIDINPLAVLASNVKTSYYDYDHLREVFSAVSVNAPRMAPAIPSRMAPARLAKWFTPDAARDLGRLRAALLEVEPGLARDFLTTAFLAVIRRASNAYDGEVRPHINPNKRPRPPLAAFAKKFTDMMRGLQELDALRPAGIPSRAVIGDNADVNAYRACTQPVNLAVAHPPYLNSFDYLPVFSLELAWSEEFPEIWLDWDQSSIRELEHRAWPATSDGLRAEYYRRFHASVEAARTALATGGVLAVVIGDATIRGRLEPVHKLFWEQLEAQGLEPLEIWFRTTHYGIGKYAYRRRADYHGDAEKRDAIMFFRAA